MWKFIVSWCIIIAVPYQRESRYDEFGRLIPHVTLEYCITYEEDCEHSMEFFDRDEAYDFYNRANAMQPDTIRGLLNDSTYFIRKHDGMLSGVKIDSLYINCE